MKKVKSKTEGMLKKFSPSGEDAQYIRLPLQSAYPKTIQFSNETYRIVFKKRKRWDSFGETSWDKKTITIKDGLSPLQLFATFVHELLHVIEFEKPMKIKHKDVYKLEQAIVEVLMSNFL